MAAAITPEMRDKITDLDLQNIKNKLIYDALKSSSLEECLAHLEGILDIINSCIHNRAKHKYL